MIQLGIVFVWLSGLSLIVKIYYTIRLQNINKSKPQFFAKMFFGVYGLGIIFPIFRKPQDSKEKKIIKGANIAIGLFYFFFITTLVLVALDSSA
jgi:hypothetical protein